MLEEMVWGLAFWGEELECELIGGWFWVLGDEEGACAGGLFPCDVAEGVAWLVLAEGEVVESCAFAVEGTGFGFVCGGEAVEGGLVYWY